MNEKNMDSNNNEELENEELENSLKTEEAAEEVASLQETADAVSGSEEGTEQKAEAQPKQKVPKKAKKKTASKPLSRKVKRRMVSTVISVLMIAAVVIVNIIAGVLTPKYTAMTTDITSLRSFDMSDQSQKIASDIKKKVKITFLTEKSTYEAIDTYCKQTSVFAAQLSQTSEGMISVEYIDLIKNPTFTDKYADENLSTTDVIVSCGKKYKVLTKNDLFNFAQYSEQYQYIESSKSEQAIDNAIMTVTSDVSTKVALVIDNAGDDYSYLESTLISNNYEVKEVSLEKDQISTDFETVIVYTPSKDFTADAVKKLENYLVNNDKYGKNLIYIPYERHTDTPNFDALIDRFGMAVKDGLAFDMDTNRLMGSSYYDAIACTYVSDQYYMDHIDENSPVLVGLARPVEVTDDRVAAPLLVLSSAGSGWCPFDAQDGKWSMTEAVTGKECVMAQGMLGNDNGTSTVVVAGSAYMFTQSYLSSDFSNSTYIFNMLADLNHRDTSVVTVKEKVISDYDLTLSQNTAAILGVALYGVIPLFILGAGLIVYWVRRYK